MTTTTKKLAKKGLAKPAKNKTTKKKVSKTWLAFLKASKDPGKITDMRAVLK